MPPSITNARDSADHRRELHARIARSRRRLERRANRFADRGLLLGSWREFIHEHPGRSVIAAAGVGALLSGMLARDDGIRSCGRRLADVATGASCESVWREVQRFLSSRQRAGEEESTGTGRE